MCYTSLQAMSCLEQTFADHASYREGEGEALCVCRDGKVVLHLEAGESSPGIPWRQDTLVPIFSATKPAAAACLLQAMAERGLTADAEVGELWAGFPAPHCSVGELLSHQAGLAAWTRTASVFDPASWRTAIESATPAWQPPQHGYHPHTLGPMVDVLMELVCGKRIGAFWEERVRRPLGLDFFIGLPESEFSRVAVLQAPRLHGAMPRSAFYREYFDPRSLIYRAFHSVTGMDSVRDMNTPDAWRCACPARGGVASAMGLALFYQTLMGSRPQDEICPFCEEVRGRLCHEEVRGWDLTLLQPTAFTCGAMCAPETLFGRGGFGHAGAGGCHAFAEPLTGCSFAYVHNGMQLGVLPGERVEDLVDAFCRDFSEDGPHHS